MERLAHTGAEVREAHARDCAERSAVVVAPALRRSAAALLLLLRVRIRLTCLLCARMELDAAGILFSHFSARVNE
jgi:hypothetical protein